MVLLSIFFTRIRSTEGSSADCSLFILSLHALALHLAVKILLQIFLCEEFEHIVPHTSVGCISSRMPAGPHFVTQPILLVKTFTNILFSSSTKHKRSDQIETIKTIMQTTRPRIAWKEVLQWLELPFLKKYSIKCEKDLDCELFYSELKRHNVSYICLSSHRYSHRVRKR